jgi:hypothetical protein
VAARATPPHRQEQAATAAHGRWVALAGVAVVGFGIGIGFGGGTKAPHARAQSRPSPMRDARPGAEPQAACEPYTQMLPVDIPASQRAVCGDGRARRGKRSCWRECTSGCPGESGCGEVQCLEGRELCDGRDVAGASCTGLGFAGGTLRCAADCTGYDVSGCSACAPGADVRCGALPLGAGAGAPVLAENGADAAVVWASGSAGGRTLHFARIDARARAASVLLPIADSRGELALAGSSGGFLLAYASPEGTFVGRVDREGALMAAPRRVAEPFDALELVRLEALAGGSAITALFLGSGPEPQALFLDGDGIALGAPPRGLVFHGVGARTRVFIVPFPRTNPEALVDGDVYETEAASGDTVLARVVRGRATVQILRTGQPFGGRMASGSDVDLTLGRGGTHRLVMREVAGRFEDSFTPPETAPLLRTGSLTTGDASTRTLARHASVHAWTAMYASNGQRIEAALVGTPGQAESLAIALVRAPRSSARGARRGR